MGAMSPRWERALRLDRFRKLVRDAGGEEAIGKAGVERIARQCGVALPGLALPSTPAVLTADQLAGVRKAELQALAVERNLEVRHGTNPDRPARAADYRAALLAWRP